MKKQDPAIKALTAVAQYLKRRESMLKREEQAWSDEVRMAEAEQDERKKETHDIYRCRLNLFEASGERREAQKAYRFVAALRRKLRTRKALGRK